jgi:hypothetical protein
METLEKYLEGALPTEREGHYYFVQNFLSNKSREYLCVKTKAEIAEKIEGWQNSNVFGSRNSEMYVAMASFDFTNIKDPKLRTRAAKHASYHRAFFVDLDCDGALAAEGREVTEADKKDYPSRGAAARAVENFAQAVDLPAPTMVSSGWGIHAYWLLDEDIPSDEWRVYATYLKKLTIKHGLKTDTVVTSDKSRILRPVGTFNYKVDAMPKPVECLRYAKPVKVDLIKEILSRDGKSDLVDFEQSKLKERTDSITAKLAGPDTKFSWKRLAAKSLDGEGCGHVAAQLTTDKPNEVSEPLWRAMLTLAVHCEERDDAILEISRPDSYEGYNEDEVVKKANDILKSGVGGHRCETIAEYAADSDKFKNICKKCKHKNKINSPLKLAIVIPENRDANLKVTGTDFATDKVKDFSIPEYPDGYVRHLEKPGVWVSTEDEQRCIYPNYLYPTERYEDPYDGVVLRMCHHNPQNDVTYFMLPNKTLVSNEECKKHLASKGVLAIDADMVKIKKYLISASRMIEEKERPKPLHVQFGWKDDYKKFVVGEVEYDGDTAMATPPASTMNDLLQYYHEEGSFDKWKEVFNLYSVDGKESQAFAVMSAFGAPLMTFTDTKGFICHLTSSESGTGKTTVQKFINSVWGDPSMMLMQDDTRNSQFHILGVLNNLPVTIDEITNIQPEAASKLAYAITQGRTKNRMSASSNKLRENTLSWCTILTTTGNSSLSDILGTNSSSPEGENARVFEIRISSTSAEELQDEKYDLITRNYGFAGRKFCSYLVKNIDEVRKRLDAKIKELITDFAMIGKERFLTDFIACNLVGGEIAVELGLINYNMPAIQLHVKNNLLPRHRAKLSSLRRDKLDHINEYLNTYLKNVLIANDDITENLAAHAENKSANSYVNNMVVARVIPSTDKLFVWASHFKKWCSENRISVDEILEKAENEKLLICRKNAKGKKVFQTKTRLAKNTAGNSASGAVSCYEFVASGVLDTKDIIKKATNVIGVFEQ